MTEQSYNGWPASRQLQTRALTVGAVTFFIADNDDVETVFSYVLGRFDREVEALQRGQCWGYNYRPNVNRPTVLSCHSSGTAVDANSAKHPNGVLATRTFSHAQIDTIHMILAGVDELAEVVHWGGDWMPPSLTPDAMHFEIHDHDLAKLHRVAERIRSLEEDAVTPEDIKAIAEYILDGETVDLRKDDGTVKAISIRNALTRILNPDES